MSKISKRKIQSCKANQVSINIQKRERIIHDELQLIYQNITQLNDNEMEIINNSLDLIELRARKRQKQIKSESLTWENLEDNERVKKANMLFENLFGQI